MKRNIIHTLWAAALLLTACTQEELPLPGADNAAPLAITVTDGGYAPTASPGDMQKATATRATENGYRTDFTAGDQCGLYIVRNGAVVYDNVKLTATTGTDGSLVWQPEAGVTLAGGLSGESYFLYYPYQENMKDKVTASATDDDGFFAPLIYPLLRFPSSTTGFGRWGVYTGATPSALLIIFHSHRIPLLPSRPAFGASASTSAP